MLFPLAPLNKSNTPRLGFCTHTFISCTDVQDPDLIEKKLCGCRLHTDDTRHSRTRNVATHCKRNIKKVSHTHDLLGTSRTQKANLYRYIHAKADADADEVTHIQSHNHTPHTNTHTNMHTLTHKHTYTHTH